MCIATAEKGVPKEIGLLKNLPMGEPHSLEAFHVHSSFYEQTQCNRTFSPFFKQAARSYDLLRMV